MKYDIRDLIEYIVAQVNRFAKRYGLTIINRYSTNLLYFIDCVNVIDVLDKPVLIHLIINTNNHYMDMQHD